MKKLLIDPKTKNIIGWAEAENFDDWNGDADLYDHDDIDALIDNLPGHYLADDGTIQFDETRIVKADPSQPPVTIPAETTLETV